ncbi:hypothetical protein REPUB_Repub10bG0007600 [Reevesia pubescens]
MVSTIDPDDIRVFGSMPNHTISNSTFLCSSFSNLQNTGIFNSSNPHSFMQPLLLLQMSIASAAILLTFYLIKPLGQPIMLAQIIIVYGRSGWNNSRAISSVPDSGASKHHISHQKFLTAGAGYMPMVLTIGISILWVHFIDPTAKKIDKLPAIAEAESVLSFPVIAYFLSELRVINSDFGRVALGSSMVSTLCSFCVITSNLLWSQSKDDLILFFQTVCYGFIFAALICFILGPLLLWGMKQISVGNPLKQGNLVALFLVVLLSGVGGHSFGLNICFGPLLFGLLIPSGPPLGSALVEKLDIITDWMLMPLFFVKFGLAVDIYDLTIRTYSRVEFFALLAACGKFLGASLSALSCQMPPKDAVSLGFVMTFQGILELGLFKLMKTKTIIDGESFAAMCASLLVTTGVITPVVRYFCKPSRRYMVCHGRTVMHLKPNTELSLLICVHDEENVPPAINLLRALNPSRQSPIAVYMLHLIELTGSATPLLIPHKKTRRISSRTSSSGPVMM